EPAPYERLREHVTDAELALEGEGGGEVVRRDLEARRGGTHARTGCLALGWRAAVGWRGLADEPERWRRWLGKECRGIDHCRSLRSAPDGSAGTRRRRCDQETARD